MKKLQKFHSSSTNISVKLQYMPTYSDLSKSKSALQYLLGHCHRNMEPNKYLLYKIFFNHNRIYCTTCEDLLVDRCEMEALISGNTSQQIYVVLCSSVNQIYITVAQFTCWEPCRIQPCHPTPEGKGTNVKKVAGK